MNQSSDWPIARALRTPALFLWSTLVLLGANLFALETRAEQLPWPLKPYGIAQRTPWTTSRVIGRPEPPPPYRAVQVFQQLKFERPLYVAPQPGTNFLLVVQQDGKILRFANDPQTAESEVFLNVGQEAYGLTFHPRYAENGYMYVVSNGPKAAPSKNDRVSRFTVSREPPYASDPASELIILEWTSNGHNGGDLAFGPDGYLYIPAGDGTTDSDTNDTGQDLTNLNATLMRIDVEHPDGERPYSVPADNPFLETPGARPEIWAYGFRNPWRLTFDREKGHLWVGNIGQDLWEMVHLVRRGENYGWSVFEGNHPFHLQRRRGPTPVTPPTVEHPHSEARSITGGPVYYGEKFPELRGAYIYGDYATGKIWALWHDGTKITKHQEIADTVVQVLGFAVDQQGEILLADYIGGLWRLEPTPPEVATAEFPRRLSETGLFSDVAAHQTVPGLIPYSVNAPQWADGAWQERYLGLPGDSHIEFNTRRGWNFQDGAVLIKTLSLEMEPANAASRRRIETQMLHREQGEWQAYSYRWNDDQTDAELVSAAGEDRVFSLRDSSAPGGRRQLTWRYAGRSECMGCHSRAANYVLGMTELQMNKRHDYGAVIDEQFRTLGHLGVFRINYLEHEKQWKARVDAWQTALDQLLTRIGERWPKVAPLRQAPKAVPLVNSPLYRPASWLVVSREWNAAYGSMLAYLRKTPRITGFLPKFPGEYRRLVDPYDRTADLELRARSYLHANCAVCHVGAGGGNSAMELEFFTERDKMKLFDVRPQHQTFGIPDARIVAPGDPFRSVLLYRVAKLGGGRMPRVWSAAVDEAAVQLFHDWIASLPAPETDPATAERLARIRERETSALDKVVGGGSGTAAERMPAVDQLLASTSGALVLLEAIHQGRLSAEVRQGAIDRAAALDNLEIRDLFEPFLPEEQRVKRLGTAIEPIQILSLQGDAERGRKVFFDAAGVACKSCHRIGSEPELVGPNLTQIGKKYQRQQLLESILEPSKTIDAKYLAFIVEDSDGRVHSGLLVRKTEQEVVLKDAQNKEIRIPADEVELIQPQGKSLMPELLLRDMTAQQVADLLEFLGSLKEAAQGQ